MEKGRIKFGSEKNRKSGIKIDTINRIAVGLVILLLVVIVYITHEQLKVNQLEHQKFENEIASLIENIQRNEAAILYISNEIDIINKVIKLNDKKERHFKAIKTQLEEASKTVPKI